MGPFWATALLLLAALAPSAPSALRRTRALATQHVVHALVSTPKGGVNHAYWFRRLFATELSARELACAKNATVLHRASGRCEWLFEQGPCAAREWLVLDAEGQQGLRAVCRPRPCAPGYGFLADERRCAPQEQLCADDRQRAFRYSLRGDGRCHCKGFRAQGPDGQCGLLYHQGACAQGQVLVPSFNRSLGARWGVCAAVACPEAEVLLEGAAAIARGDDLKSAAGRPPETSCAVFGDLDCSPQMASLLSAEADAQVPVCDYSQRTIFVAPRRPDSCLRDPRGRCLETEVLTSDAYGWKIQGESNKAARTSRGFLLLLSLSLCVVFSELLT